MPSEKTVGGVFVIIGIIVVAIFIIWGLLPFIVPSQVYMLKPGEMTIFNSKIWVPPLYWLLFIPIFLAVLLLCLILIWIGATLIRLPAPEEIDIEKLEKELEKELKEEEKTEEKTEKEEKQ